MVIFSVRVCSLSSHWALFSSNDLKIPVLTRKSNFKIAISICSQWNFIRIILENKVTAQKFMDEVNDRKGKTPLLSPFLSESHSSHFLVVLIYSPSLFCFFCCSFLIACVPSSLMNALSPLASLCFLFSLSRCFLSILFAFLFHLCFLWTLIFFSFSLPSPFFITLYIFFLYFTFTSFPHIWCFPSSPFPPYQNLNRRSKGKTQQHKLKIWQDLSVTNKNTFALATVTNSV